MIGKAFNSYIRYIFRIPKETLRNILIIDIKIDLYTPFFTSIRIRLSLYCLLYSYFSLKLSPIVTTYSSFNISKSGFNFLPSFMNDCIYLSVVLKNSSGFSES